jgi:Arc/MetJ-type ribon-helix-helix transcriptional regulator
LTLQSVRRTSVRLSGFLPVIWRILVGLTERIELRLDDAVLKRVDEWVERTGNANSRSDALRQLVDIGLSAATGKSIQLSAGDKLTFMLLRDIAKHLEVPTETNLDFMAEVIYGGHYWAPTWDMQGLFHDHADRPADVTLVVNVLDMWSFVEEAIEVAPVVQTVSGVC